MDLNMTLITSRDDILAQIASQAADVRRQFESHPSKRKHAVSSATAAAAQHMASLNRKRRFESSLVVRNAAGEPVCVDDRHVLVEGNPDCSLVWKQTSHTFHSPIASFTRPEKSRQVSTSSAPGIVQHAPAEPVAVAPAAAPAAPAAPRVSDGIVLKSAHGDVTVSYNDVVCGKGKTTSSLVGNQRYRVWVSLHKGAYAEAFSDDERLHIAASIVDAVATSVPAGRFLSLDIHTGLWYDVGYDRAVGITMETLMAESGMMKRSHSAVHCPQMKRVAALRTYASRAA